MAKWGLEISKNATGSSPPPLLVVKRAKHTLYLARYNNTFVKPNARAVTKKAAETLNWTLPADSIEAAIQLAERYKVFDKAAFNGTDWVAATAGSVTPIAYGNKTWLYTAAINTWLDFPAPRPEEGRCVLHGDFREFIDYLMPPEEARRLRERVDNLTRAICQFHQWLGYRSYHLRIDAPAHRRLLTVAVN
jgi:hypothetical protein